MDRLECRRENVEQVLSSVPGFQSFSLTGFEAFGATSLESRALPQLVVFIAIDEADVYTIVPDLYSENLAMLVAAHSDAAQRRYNFVVAIAHYRTSRFPTGQADPAIVPPGVSFPSHVARIIADDIPRRDTFPENDHGYIVESAETWFNWIDLARSPGLLGEDSRVTIVLDDSGSMLRAHFQSIPDETIVLLAERFPRLETKLLSDGNETWLKRAAEEWEDFIESRQ